MTGTGEAVVFWILSCIAVPGALALLFARKAVHAAIGMVTTMIVLGVFYLLQEAPFLGVVHIFVYTGAVMMLFLFVVMLVGVDAADSLVETLKGQRLLTALVSVVALLVLFAAIGRVAWDGDPSLAEVNTDPGNVEGIAYLVFGRYVWLFEVTAGLLTVAALGAMVFAHRERIIAKPTQKEWMERRFREGRHLAGLPVPGVYARHNAVDTPALLPDGSTSDLSLNRVLVARDQVTTPTRYRELEDTDSTTEGGERR
ncbi:NADH-quinone oxidoreductase subunit J [Janibacter terrae]|jgi:NADH-quinone oxidoreductase subunit J|uniref:NADH-quinone oxidoreductase subunit J n=1 Tax=Janibacter terrae TaxID=103817 RepID=UPI00082ED7C4|nr:NADH-quinone oxidoreductase subunit J [Janibacter terrae]MBA4085753.1 NADH-quinone oxidoreductase subunit J [Kytococcus sp.]HCE60917.1 NADH-quinone oxidoreductase subunit J [Janibacter terrae]